MIINRLPLAQHNYENCRNHTCRERIKQEGYNEGYNKAIDDFISRLEKHTQENWIDHQVYGITWADIEQITQQMKGGAKEP